MDFGAFPFGVPFSIQQRLPSNPHILARFPLRLTQNAIIPCLLLFRGLLQNGNLGLAASVTSNISPVICVRGSSAVFGSRLIPSEQIDRAFGMPEGKLRDRAGIVSLAYVSEGEQEIDLAVRAAYGALQASDMQAKDIDWLLATSETHRGYPSLAAQLHARLQLRANCGALDIGGACLGLLNAFEVAAALLRLGPASKVLIVTADVHSRILVPGRVPGEFGGLFGDGASVFLLSLGDGGFVSPFYSLGGLFFGCASQYAGAIRLSDGEEGKINLVFDGEALSRAAITKLAELIAGIESRSGISRFDAGAFATHQPNPRLVALLARQLGLPPDRFPPVAQTRGNLGSSTCGAALHEAIVRTSADKPAPIFLASLGPGLLTGAGWIVPETKK